ncbi:acyl-CoA N-acyltransferase [Coniochaeta ligniaria NRRL 30616]|uniref:Acyl-CoA N-acyltransferase n=1 Tax=Coniochaeta ligniaria NRRL 30616 TaxID=1408157 RepID=A0A1J7K536_9PEZI|nr:acyl-CoA N-acyltransferase [Coniochaeta ligniaria NRRL 30616]
MATTIHIREIRPSEKEAREMESLGLQAFTNVAMHSALFPRGEESREEQLRWRSQRFRTNLQNPMKHFVVAVEETEMDDGTSKDQIIGWAQWAAPPAVPQPEKSEEEKAKEMQEKMRSWPDAMDKEAYKKILEGFAELDKQWLAGDDPTNYWVLDVLAVHPGHQRKGLGSKLTRWGIERAAKEGKGVGLISRPTAKRLYASLGFQTFGPERYAGGDSQTAMRLERPSRSASASSP